MELFSANYEENTRALDDLLGVGRCFDMISRDLYVGGRRARLWVVDGYGDDAVIERMLSFWLPLRDVSNAQTMQQFIDRYITFNEVNAEQNVKNTVTSVFLGKMALLVEGYDECALIDAKQYPARGVEEPSSGKVLRGAHDGFIETLVANAALLRRRIRAAYARRSQGVGLLARGRGALLFGKQGRQKAARRGAAEACKDRCALGLDEPGEHR